MKYLNKFRISRISKAFKNSIITYLKGDVPTYIADDVMNELDNGKEEITIHMTLSLYEKSIVQYLNEYHKEKNYAWKLDFLQIAFDLTAKKISKRLSFCSDIEIEVLDFSETDKRILIKYMGKKGERHNDRTKKVS